MSVELILILGLLLILVLPIFLDLNVGIVALVVAFLAGTFLLDLSAGEILVGFPGSIVVMLIGILLLMSIAQANGTVDWLVNKLVWLARGRLILMPWVLFTVAILTSSMGPAAPPCRASSVHHGVRLPTGPGDTHPSGRARRRVQPHGELDDAQTDSRRPPAGDRDVQARRRTHAACAQGDAPGTAAEGHP